MRTIFAFRICRASLPIFLALAIGALPSGSVAQDAPASPPAVVEAAVPFYPPTARAARIQGTVKLRVTVREGRAVNTAVISGPPVLASAASDNIRTWRFRQTGGASIFEVTFTYRIERTSQCTPDSGQIRLSLPLSVDISASGVRTCDPHLGAGDAGTEIGLRR